MIPNKPVETAPVPTPAPAPVPTNVQEVKTTTTPTEVKTEVSDVEKQAQATGMQYTMENGQPIYNATTKEDALKVLQMG